MTLGNCYFAMRHGDSRANTERRIVSDPEAGIDKYGLTDRGRQQVTASAREFLDISLRPREVRIYSSDFLRARQTAELLAGILGSTDGVTTVPNLRERYFGGYEGMSTRHYDDVWALDAADAYHRQNGVESVASVAERVRALVADLEQRHSGKQLILVAHGDVLQIAQTLFDDVPGNRHRQLRHLETAEIRRLDNGQKTTG